MLGQRWNLDFWQQGAHLRLKLKKFSFGFVGEEEDFKLDALGNREPVEVLKDESDVITGTGVGEETGSRVLDVLDFI